MKTARRGGKQGKQQQARAEKAKTDPSSLSVGVAQDDLLFGMFGKTSGFWQAPSGSLTSGGFLSLPLSSVPA